MDSQVNITGKKDWQPFPLFDQGWILEADLSSCTIEYCMSIVIWTLTDIGDLSRQDSSSTPLSTKDIRIGNVYKYTYLDIYLE